MDAAVSGRRGAPDRMGFFLVLKKTKRQQRVSLCLNGLVKTSPTAFVLEKRDFVPEQDLDIVFLDPWKGCRVMTGVGKSFARRRGPRRKAPTNPSFSR